MMISLRLAAICCLITLHTYSEATMGIPSSFSSAHKTSYLSENSPIESVLKVLSSFEIDSHIDVVLIGESFTSKMVDELSNLLLLLSDVASAASPLKFVHEEVIVSVSSLVRVRVRVRVMVRVDQLRLLVLLNSSMKR
jgi:hypothetical protein